MSLYFGTTEITNIDNLVPQSGLDITDLWFGSTNVYTVWAVYEDTLPATLNANGDNMKQYQIYGNTGGVGDDSGTAYGYEVDMSIKSANLFDKHTFALNAPTSRCSAEETETGIKISATAQDPFIGVFINVGSSGASYQNIAIKIKPGEIYTLSASVLPKCFVSLLDDNFICTSAKSVLSNPFTFTSGENDQYAILRLGKQDLTAGQTLTFSDIIFTQGNVAEYQPYFNETVPIYIGDTALQKYEYIDYEVGKVYRRTDNIFNIDDLWDKGTTDTGVEASKFLEISVQNGTYTAGTNVPDNSNSNIASVFIADSIAINPSSSINGVFINRPRTITTTTGKLYIGIRVRSVNGYQTFTKETFAPYYINVVAGSTVPTNAIPYFQPTDPPVALPALPTCEGTTIVDYAGQSAAQPEKVLLKYRKEGF